MPWPSHFKRNAATLYFFLCPLLLQPSVGSSNGFHPVHRGFHFPVAAWAITAYSCVRGFGWWEIWERCSKGSLCGFDVTIHEDVRTVFAFKGSL